MGSCLSSGQSSSDHEDGPRYQEFRDERNGLLTDRTSQQTYGSQKTDPPRPRIDVSGAASDSSVGGLGFSTSRSTAKSISAKPLGQFLFLDRKYTMDTPECGIPQIDEVFKSVCERYDIAVTNREKIDEALTLFKQVLGMELDVPLEECFSAWKGYLVNPRFIVNCKEATGDVKDIRVRADDIPRERRKAQKHIRDLLDACHLFLQQREFLERNIVSDLTQLESLSKNLQSLAERANLSSSQKKHLTKVFSTARAQVNSFPETIEMFWRQVYSLMHDINTSVHVLDGVPGPESADLR